MILRQVTYLILKTQAYGQRACITFKLKGKLYTRWRGPEGGGGVKHETFYAKRSSTLK